MKVVRNLQIVFRFLRNLTGRKVSIVDAGVSKLQVQYSEASANEKQRKSS